MELRGRVIVVTGASRGLGAGLARRFSELGASTGLCARSMRAAATSSGRTVAAAVDVADATAVEEFTATVVAELGPIDLWVNNAGALGDVVDLRDLAATSAKTVVATNLLGVLHGTQSFIRHRRGVGGGGVLVNMSSGAANAPHPGLGLYCVTKSGVLMLTDVVNEEERETGLRAYAVEPGAVDTDMQAELRAASERFRDVVILRQLKEDGLLTSTRHVADHIAAMAFGPEQPDPGRWVVPPEHSRMQEGARR